LRVLRAHGIETRPSFPPFTPWTTFGDLLDPFALADHNLIGDVAPCSNTVRLLLPEQSLSSTTQPSRPTHTIQVRPAPYALVPSTLWVPEFGRDLGFRWALCQ
jgi:hypothetical protein